MQKKLLNLPEDDEIFLDVLELDSSLHTQYCRGAKYPTRKYLIEQDLDLSCINTMFSEKFYLDFLQNKEMQKFYFDAANKHLLSTPGFCFDEDVFIIYPREIYHALLQLDALKKIDISTPQNHAVYQKIKKLCSLEHFVKKIPELNNMLADKKYDLSDPTIAKFFDKNFNFDKFAKEQNNSFEFRKSLYTISALAEELALEYFFEIPQKIQDRLEKLDEYEYGDFANVDFVLNDKLSQMDIFNQPVVNPKLKHYVLKDMPSNLDRLGQALYVYYKLCHTLQYDDNYYNEGYVFEPQTPHRNVKETINITPQNNNVICTEFTAIYAVLLRDLGFTPHIHYRTMDKTPHIATDAQFCDYTFPYDGTHVWVEMSVDQFVFRADSTPSIIAGDLAKVKFGGLCEIEDGLKCHNISQDSQNKFWQTAENVKQIIAQENAKKVDALRGKTFQDCDLAELRIMFNYNAKKLYEKLPSHHYPISFEMRVQLLCKIVENVNLHGLELAQFLMNIKDNIFSGQEYTNRQTGKAKFSFVRDDTDFLHPETAVLFSYDLGKDEQHRDIRYCVLDGRHKARYYTLDQVENKYRGAEFIELVDGSQPLGMPHIKCK